MPVADETCSRCGRSIPPTETPYLVDNATVCQACHAAPIETKIKMGLIKIKMWLMRKPTMNRIAVVIASLALLFSLASWVRASRPHGKGLRGYKFDTPLNAHRSELRISLNNDALAWQQYAGALNDRKLREKLDTLKIAKTREHKGATILFFEYKEAGLPKREFVALEKDAESGYWHKVYVAAYSVRKEGNPALADEIEGWEE